MPTSHVISLRISERCLRAWKYLEQHNVRAAELMRAGGEANVIATAIQFHHKQQRKKMYGEDVPDWLFD